MSKHSVFQAIASMFLLAAVIFIPQAHNGVRNWFTTSDVLSWIARTGDVMPVFCYETNGVFTSCKVVQAKALRLTWNDTTKQVEAVAWDGMDATGVPVQVK